MIDHNFLLFQVLGCFIFVRKANLKILQSCQKHYSLPKISCRSGLDAFYIDFYNKMDSNIGFKRMPKVAVKKTFKLIVHNIKVCNRPLLECASLYKVQFSPNKDHQPSSKCSDSTSRRIEG